jgi:hypothetical protein
MPTTLTLKNVPDDVYERRHSSLGNVTPVQFEQRWHAAVKSKAQGAAPVRHRVTRRRPVPGSSQATELAARG